MQEAMQHIQVNIRGDSFIGEQVISTNRAL
jgi:hypothetical protein